VRTKFPEKIRLKQSQSYELKRNRRERCIAEEPPRVDFINWVCNLRCRRSSQVAYPANGRGSACAAPWALVMGPLAVGWCYFGASRAPAVFGDVAAPLRPGGAEFCPSEAGSRVCNLRDLGVMPVAYPWNHRSDALHRCHFCFYLLCFFFLFWLRMKYAEFSRVSFIVYWYQKIKTGLLGSNWTFLIIIASASTDIRRKFIKRIGRRYLLYIMNFTSLQVAITRHLLCSKEL